MPDASQALAQRLQHRLRFGFALLLALALAGLAHASGPLSPLQGRVLAVGDGDSVTLRDAHQRTHRVRLHGIDAPELTQAWGPQAKAHLQSLLLAGEVELVFGKTDRHDRLVGTLWVQGRDINRQMVYDGMAWHHQPYAHEQKMLDRWRYAQAERKARQQRRGLWADAQPQPPWEYRRQARNPPGAGRQ